MLFIIRTRTSEAASRSQGVQDHQVHVPDEIAQVLKPADVVRLDEPANDHANLARKEQAAHANHPRLLVQLRSDDLRLLIHASGQPVVV